jgi:hypothetical protein
MSTYAALLKALNARAESPELESLVAQLNSPGKLKKSGGYRASIAAKASGIHLSFTWSKPSWVLHNAILFAAGVDGFSQFHDPIEGRVPMSAARSEVHAALGFPSQSGGGGAPIMNVLVDYHWDRFDFKAYSVRFDYEQEHGAIRMVSVMTRELMLQLNPSRAQVPAPPAQ